MEYNFVNFLLDEILGLFDFYFDIEIFASEFKSAKLSLLLWIRLGWIEWFYFKHMVTWI